MVGHAVIRRSDDAMSNNRKDMIPYLLFGGVVCGMAVGVLAYAATQNVAAIPLGLTFGIATAIVFAAFQRR